MSGKHDGVHQMKQVLDGGMQPSSPQTAARIAIASQGISIVGLICLAWYAIHEMRVMDRLVGYDNHALATDHVFEAGVAVIIMIGVALEVAQIRLELKKLKLAGAREVPIK